MTIRTKTLPYLLSASAVVATTSCVTAKSVDSSPRPNVLFILIDDFGWMDTGYNGSTFYETPYLDTLSKEFFKFNYCNAPSPMSSPTRASIMTGKNPARHGITQWLPGRGDLPGHDKCEMAVLTSAPKVQSISKSEVTIAEALQEAGYNTGFFGKWHLGKLNASGGPIAHGFDEQTAVIEANRCNMQAPFNDPTLYPNAKVGENFTDLLTDSAIEFIDRPRDKPFFVYLSHFAMHHPISSEPDKLAYFEQKAKQLPELNEQERFIYDEEYSHEALKRRQDSAQYAGELSTLDDNIGRIVQHLKDKGLYDNTIIIITGDNGGRTFHKNHRTSVYPMRGGKAFTFSGGLRTPLLIHYPKIDSQGCESDEIVTSTDFYPTILDMAGLPLHPEQHQDGVSLLPLLSGKKLENRDIYFHFPHYQVDGSYPTSAIYSNGYKLIVNYHQRDMLLFDTRNDIHEYQNIIDMMPEKAQEMRSKLFDYLKEVGAVIPQDNPSFNPQKTL